MPTSKGKPSISNLPTPLSTFIGREREIAEVKQLLSSNRLVTLTGAGGSGKTRLALKLAHELIGEFEHGVWLVELASLFDPALVPQTVATTLKVREQSGRALMDILKDYLSTRHSLLVMDNCEHLVLACAQIADVLLQKCADLKILATSREGLGIMGEIAWPVPSLSLPGQQPWTNPASAQDAVRHYEESESVQLFVTRAKSISPDFALNSENGSWVAEICRRLDGMPLAIELAAARVRILSVQQIAQRLDDRFHLLSGGSRTAPPRQQTLASTLDWSYELLSEKEQKVLQRLSVFAGGATMETAEFVCSGDGVDAGEVLDTLSHLVDKSLVVADQRSREMRYVLLETIRQYARERLVESGEADVTQRRHAEFFTTWVDRMGMELRAGTTQLDRFKQLEMEQGNIYAALEWSLGGGDSDLGLRLISSTFYFWWRGGYWLEWEHWMARVPAHIDRVSEATRAATLVAMTAMDLHDKHDMDSARRHGKEALALYRRLEDAHNIAWAIFWLNTASIELMENADVYAKAIASTEEAIDLLRQEGELASIAQGLTNLGVYAYTRGDYVRAKAAFQESLEIARSIGDQIREHLEYFNLGELALNEGDYETAMAFLKKGLSWAKERENFPLILSGFTNLTVLWLQRGQHQRAAQLIGAGEALSEKWGVKLQQSEGDFDVYSLMAREKLGDQAFNTLWAEGQAMTLEQAIDCAIAKPEPAEIEVSLKEKFGGLTAREREVAALIAQGKSNRQIAEAMTVGVRTVETYVTRILNKLGFDSRVQIATWAVEKGLAAPMHDSENH